VEQATLLRRVLLVDDEPNVLRALKRVLRRIPWDLQTANSGEEALQLMAESPVDVVVCDYRMPGMTGVDFLRQVRDRWPDTQRLMLSGQADQSAILEAVNRSEIFRFIPKPWEEADLLATIHSALSAATLAQENRRLLALTLAKNEELARLNAQLEQRVQERTALLSQSQREWQATFDALTLPLAIVDRHFALRRANLAWQRQSNLPFPKALKLRCHQALFGRSEPCEGCPLPGLQPGSAVEETIHHGDRWWVVSAYPWPGSQGDEGPWAVVSYREVTEERKAQAWQLRAERLAAVGRLAGGVAHEINNPLSGVLAFAQLMRREPGRSSDDEESLQLIEESALRCKHIVESLQRFAGQGQPRRQVVDLRVVTTDAVTLFRSALKALHKHKLEVATLPAELPSRVVDPQALGQALMDLLHHRLLALPPAGGTLSLSLFHEGEHLGWQLSDTAPALDTAAIERLADPAFALEGGLGQVFRVVREHQGQLDVTPSPEGRGNEFTMRLGQLDSP
jgi:two-component system NtrC family sensor kinase